MLIIAYFIIYVATIYFIVKPLNYNNVTFKIVWFSIAILHSLLLRLSLDLNIESDLTNYIRIMQLDDSLFNTPYFQREFIFFYSMRYLYSLIKNPILVFLIMDFVLLFYLFKFLKGFFNLNRLTDYLKRYSYIFFLILLFFPVVDGLNNVYRQIFALVIFSNSLNYVQYKKYGLAFIFFIISIFIHNSILLFLPIFILMFKNKFLNYLSYILLIMFSLVFTYLKMDNSILDRAASLEQEIGINIAQLIFYVLVLIFIIYQFINSKIKFENKVFNNFLIINSGTYFILMLNMGSLSSLRISYSVFFLLLPYLALILENSFLQKTTTRLVFFHLSLFPLFTITGPFLGYL